MHRESNPGLWPEWASIGSLDARIVGEAFKTRVWTDMDCCAALSTKSEREDPRGAL